MKRENFVAHRGYAARYPENTLLAMEKAVEAGALFLECDLQLTADHVPVLFHDPSLKRMTGRSGYVMRKSFAELQEFPVSEPHRFGEGFSHLKITPLSEVVGFLKKNPGVTIFLELKESSLNRYGVDLMVRKVMEVAAPVINRCVAISYSLASLVSAREQGWGRTGWVLKRFDRLHRRKAEGFAPDYLFCDYRDVLPAEVGTLWQGPWKWVLFEIVEPQRAEKWFALGADMVETMEIEKLLTNS